MRRVAEGEALAEAHDALLVGEEGRRAVDDDLEDGQRVEGAAARARGVQVGDGRRILVANLKGDVDEESTDEWIAMINPVIVERSDRMIRWDESCLSVPEYELDVDRHHRIHVQWRDVAGDPQQGWFEEFPAVVLQHEMDHLDGVTLLDRSSRMKRSRYLARRKKARRG